MLTRIISAAVAIVIAVAVLCVHNTIALNIAVALLIIIALYELFRAQSCLDFKFSQVVCYLFALVFPFRKYLIRISDKAIIISLAIFICMIFISFLADHKSIKYEKLCFMVFETVFVSAALSSLTELNDMSKEHGLFYLVLTLCGAWLADSGAYFAGTFLGKHKLCPNISPKKTVEGVAGGVLTNGVIFIILGLVYTKLICDGASANYFALFILGMICALLGLLGDLSASLIKRQAGIKDYGNIMPGHGGVMDRFDSVLFVAPFMALVLGLFNIIK